MKSPNPFARLASLVTLLALLPTLAQAHPGHFAGDWLTAPPHPGHESEYAFWLSVAGVLTLALGIYRLATRKR